MLIKVINTKFGIVNSGNAIPKLCANTVKSARELLQLITTCVVFYEHKFLERK